MNNFSIDAGAGSPLVENMDAAQLLMALKLQGKIPSSVFLIPDVAEQLLHAASQQFLTLAPGERLLAVIGLSNALQKSPDCALTTHGVHFRHKPVKGSGDGFNPVRCPGFVAYADLPPDLKRRGLLVPRISLGPGVRIVFGSEKTSANFVVEFLTRARAIAHGEASVPVIEPENQAAFDRWILSVGDFSNRLRPQLTEIRSFASRMAATKRSLVVPVIVLACVAVFGWMCAKGVSPTNPTIDNLIASGASFGPSIFGDHEYWRVITALFVHVGIVHLLMNMLVLLSAGPAVEKLFGHLGFAFLYLISGLGGALASLAYHPMLISAGASGAIFGIFGALIAILLVRRSEVPVPILQQQLKSLGVFIGMNLFLGFMIPNIDMAAHAGGFVAGFACGGALAATSRATGGKRFVAKLATGLAFTALLAGSAFAVNQRVLTQLETMPEFRSIKAEPAWNSFINAAEPLLQEFDNLHKNVVQILADQQILPGEVKSLQQLLDQSSTLKSRMADLPVADPDLASIRALLVNATDLRGKSIDRLLAFMKNGNKRELDGPEGFEALSTKIDREIQSFLNARDAYFQKNGLHVAPITNQKQ